MSKQADQSRLMADQFQEMTDEAKSSGDDALASVLSRRAEEWRNLAAEQQAAWDEEVRIYPFVAGRDSAHTWEKYRNMRDSAEDAETDGSGKFAEYWNAANNLKAIAEEQEAQEAAELAARKIRSKQSIEDW